MGRWHPASPSPLNCSAWPLPPQKLHGTPLPGLVAGQATMRTSWWRNISGASGGTTQTAGMLWRYSPAAMVRDSVEGLGGLGFAALSASIPQLCSRPALSRDRAAISCSSARSSRAADTGAAVVITRVRLWERHHLKRNTGSRATSRAMAQKNT